MTNARPDILTALVAGTSIQRGVVQAITVALAAGSLLLFLRLFTHKGPVTDDTGVPGIWSDGRVLLELSSNGGYAIGFSTTGGFALAECGRWRAIEGVVQMRSRWSARSATPSALLKGGGIRAGEYRLTHPDQLDLDLKSGSEDAGLWRLHPAPETIDFREAEKPRLDGVCGLGPGS